MSHFAEIDTDRNNLVLRVVVVANKDTADADGVEKEHIGAAFLESVLGGTWKQTSYNGKLRKNYAGVGYTYRADIDAFVAPKPYPSWVLDENAQWQAPVPMPDDGEMYSWDEDAQSWVHTPVEGAPV
jgi:hypothetical protein